MSSADHPRVIGVTGHRLNVLTAERAGQLGGEIAAVLTGIAGARAAEMILVSSLAEGADRIAADAALSAGMILHALLPFARDAYGQDFAGAESQRDYARLLSRAAKITERPVARGTADMDARAYEACGAEMVGLCDLLIAVWDGKDGRGIGGTRDVIEMALQARKPVIWIDSLFCLPPLLVSALPGGGRALERLAPS